MLFPHRNFKGKTKQHQISGYFPSFAHPTNTTTTIATNATNTNTIRSSGCTFSRQQLQQQQQQQQSLTADMLVDKTNSNIFESSSPERQDTSAANESTDSLYSGISSRYQLLDNSEENYECPQCYRTYRRHGTLRRHMRQECGKGKSMVCSVCGHRTKRADHLRQHVRKKHPEMAMRSLFRRPATTSATGNNNHGVRSHGGYAHRLPPHQQRLQPMLSSYTETTTRSQLEESLDATKAPLPFNTTTTSMPSTASSFMGVEVVDLDTEGDNNDDDDDDDDNDNDRNDTDKFDSEENNKVSRQLRKELVGGANNAHGGKLSMIGNSVSNQPPTMPQNFYQLRHFQHQHQHQRQRQQCLDDSFKGECAD